MKQLLKYILAEIFEHQKLAETKHGVGIALTSGIAVVIIGFISSGNIFVRLLAMVALSFCLMSLLLSFMAVSSKLIKVKEKNKKKEIVNYMYFKDIKNFSPLQYLDELSRAYDFPEGYTPDSFEIDLAKTIISLSQRTSSKYSLFNYSLICIFFALFFLFLSGVILGGFSGILF